MDVLEKGNNPKNYLYNFVTGNTLRKRRTRIPKEWIFVQDVSNLHYITKKKKEKKSEILPKSQPHPTELKKEMGKKKMYIFWVLRKWTKRGAWKSCFYQICIIWYQLFCFKTINDEYKLHNIIEFKIIMKIKQSINNNSRQKKKKKKGGKDNTDQDETKRTAFKFDCFFLWTSNDNDYLRNGRHTES